MILGGRAARFVLVLALAATAAAGCGRTTSPAPSGCADGDTRAPGALPQLEALLPRGMVERSPDTLDSGVNCSPASLDTYAAHGVGALAFAGATWDEGGGDATVVAVLANADPAGPVLRAPWAEEFYATGARRSTKTENIKIDSPTMPAAGAAVWRLETLNELSLQTVVVWPAEPYVHVVIVATRVEPGASRTEHDQRVEIAVEQAAAVPLPPPSGEPQSSSG